MTKKVVGKLKTRMQEKCAKRKPVIENEKTYL